MKHRTVIGGPLHSALIRWFESRIGVEGSWDTPEAQVIAHVIDTGRPAQEEDVLCVVLLNHWTPHTVEGNIVSDGTKRWANRQFIYDTYHYVFEHANKTRFNFTVDPANTAAIAMHEALGHKLEGRFADAAGEGKDLLVYGLTRRDWRAGKWAQPRRPVNKPKAMEPA